jgi:hypothetical protein
LERERYQACVFDDVSLPDWLDFIIFVNAIWSVSSHGLFKSTGHLYERLSNNIVTVCRRRFSLRVLRREQMNHDVRRSVCLPPLFLAHCARKAMSLPYRANIFKISFSMRGPIVRGGDLRSTTTIVDLTFDRLQAIADRIVSQHIQNMCN